MVTDMTWNDFASRYYEQLKDIARMYLYSIKKKSSHWDARINEEDICENATIDTLESAYNKFDSSKEKTHIEYMSRIVHNNIYDELKDVQKYLGASVDNLGDHELVKTAGEISTKYNANLKECLYDSISKLKDIDQIIIKYYINNPKTFIADVKEDFKNLSENAISIRKNRAIKQLASLMRGKAYDDYINAQYQGGGTSFGFLQAMPTGRHAETHVNRIDPQFNLNEVTSKFYRFIEQYIHLRLSKIIS